MSSSAHSGLIAHFVDGAHLPAGTTLNTSDPQGGNAALRRLWKLTDLSAGDFADEIASYHNLPRIDLPALMAAASCADRFTARFLREMTVFPYRRADGSAALVLADPSDESAIRAAEIVLGSPVAVEVGSFEDIGTILNVRLGEEEAAAAGADLPHAHAEDDIESLRDLASGAPVVRAVNDLLEKAVDLRASDIHIEPFRAGLTVRMRVDGLLRAVPTPAGVPPAAVISRIKILAGLNIAERRLPQDGAARARIGTSEIDVRVATMPTQHGESAVMRLLAKDRGLLEIGGLGLARADEQRLSRLLALPHGMIVITGPTGSGKTTTLATMLSILNEPTRKILTIEDPVEYEIPGISQSQVKPGIGLTFATALRSFVRQDPDVIMVGEVRDAETAHIAQRLVRVLCERCKTTRTLSEPDLAADPRYSALGFRAGDMVHEPGRCDRCGGVGYRGRKGVFEVLEMTPDVRALVGAETDAGTVEEAAVRAGMTTMVEDAVAKCRSGMTSAAEVLRVTTAH